MSVSEQHRYVSHISAATQDTNAKRSDMLRFCIQIYKVQLRLFQTAADKMSTS